MIQQLCGKLLNQTKKRGHASPSSPPECYEFGKWHLVCYLRRPRRYPAQMFNQTGYCLTLKRPVVDACKMPNMLVPIHSARWEIVRSDGGSNGGGLVPVPLPFSTSVSWSLRSCPIQTEECINCSAEFPSVFVDDFPRGLTEGCFFFFSFFFFPTSSVCNVTSSERSLLKVWLSAELSSRR